MGLAGLASAEGPFRGGLLADSGDLAHLRRILGWWGAVRAVTVRSFGEHRPTRGELYVDGIAVDPAVRGQGIGTRLMAEIAAVGREGRFRWVRLEVVDTNPRAQRLYERLGYRVTDVQRFGYMRRFIGFGGVTTMELDLDVS